ncbi:hypothetical protein MLD38_023349 [Melastoma candidum]|uniref:Uncharacterized protein n=1 Tax=Melastoma candidum TaxID=119954 RepID=A0ACB9QM91_9MYRT|nr:hypothetical protein MLD38_023349 [Melastoma candidum]
MGFLFTLDLVGSAEGCRGDFSRSKTVIDKESDSSKEEIASENLINGEEKEDESEKLRKSAFDKLENASQDTVLSRGLKVLDKNVENLASGAWLETSAANFAKSLSQGGLQKLPVLLPHLCWRHDKRLLQRGYRSLNVLRRK